MESAKVVLITGTINGIGRAAAEALAREGHTVFASMRESAGRNLRAADALRGLGEKEGLALKVLDLDVTDDASVENAVRDVAAQAGHIDVVVNNGGVLSYGVLEAFTVEQAMETFQVNFFGNVRVNRAVLPLMREQGSGLLIHVSSGLGRIVAPAMGFYAPSKWALEAMAEIYRYELSGFGIDSLILELGVYPTNMNVVAGAAADLPRSDAHPRMTEFGAELKRHFRDDYMKSNPSEVGEVLARMIEAKPERRLLRWRVGPLTEGLEPINKTSAEVQVGILEAFDLGNLARLAR